MIGKEPSILKYAAYESRVENPHIFYRIKKPARSIATAQSGVQRRKLRTWTAHAKQLDMEIERLEREIMIEEHNFKEMFGIDIEEAPAEIERIREEICEKERTLRVKEARISEIEELQEALEIEHQTQLLLIELDPDKAEIYRFMKEMKETPQNPYEKEMYDQCDRQLNTITDENFKKIIARLPEEQAQALIKARKTKRNYNL